VFHGYDFDLNGSVDYGDVAELQKYFGKDSNDAEWDAIGHIDIAEGNGVIDVADLMQILVYVRANS
jgi:Ca2+-binding EF-hand superfamily protein